MPRVLTLPDSQVTLLPHRAKALLFDDPRSAQLIDHVERIARSEASVLITGETGTGKELIARHVHRHSGRKGPFLAVNCGAFSEALIDAELFGHESGAFTGATQARAGWFEAAHGGTLFLDEIGDLPLSLQVKLLRVLQERQVVRLGSRNAIAVDVRLVAATNVELQRAVEAQHFRADLYWRISVAPISLPPLRERRGDVLPLAYHFIGVYGPRLGAGGFQLSPAAQSALLSYAWPGNIRELENVIHFALIVCRDGCIGPGDLKLVGVASPVVTATQAVPVVPPPQDPAAKLPAADLLAQVLDGLLSQEPSRLMQQVEETLVRRAYAFSRDNQVKAARVLGITRNSMRTLLKRYGLIGDGPDTAPVSGGTSSESLADASSAAGALVSASS
jgi:sigma-54-specific transcriptional regulator